MPSEGDVIPSASKADILKKIGRTLEEKRKIRGLTQEKVAQALRFRVSFVKALEDGNWQELPGEVYGRGFLTRYAQLVGLNPKELMAPYLESNSAPESKPESAMTVEPTFEFPRSGFVWAGVGLIALVAIVKFITADLNSAKNPSANSGELEFEKAAVIVSTVTTAVPHTGEVHTLEILSPLPLWMSVKSKTKSFEGFIPQSSTWSWKAEGQFNIRMGHTQQVVLLFDGKQVALGENQKRLQLPSEN